MQGITMVATCLFGLEKLLGEEIDALGCTRIDTMDGRVTFKGELADICRANIELRCAERVFIKLGECRAATFTELFDGVHALPWHAWIGAEDAFPVKGHSVKSKLFSVPDCQKIIKKAVATRLSEEYGTVRLPETGVKYQIEFFLFKDTAAFMIDTTGLALHKRGYRPETVAAPLRETLAAALVKISRPRENVLLWDPFCGSGTIAIEAAMIMQNRAPGLSRSFAAEAFPQIGAECWKTAREKARAAVRPTSFRARATDLDPDCVRITKESASRAGVADLIETSVLDARAIRKPIGVRGTIVTNPPYGERLMTPGDAARLYRAIGPVFRALEPWQIYILSAATDFERSYGKRADKVRKLYNGMIPCYLYQYFKSAPASRSDPR